MNLDRRPWIRAFSYPSDPGIMALCRLAGSKVGQRLSDIGRASTEPESGAK